MKIFFLIRSLDSGGAERQLVCLVKKMHERGYHTRVIVYYPGGFFEKDLVQAGISVVSLNKKGRWDIIGFFWGLLRYLRLEKPDVLHGYLSTANIMAAFVKPFLMHTRIIWGIRSSNMDLKRYDWLTRLSYKVECILSKSSDLIIANSKAGMKYSIENGFPKNKIIVIPNGIDTDRFNPDRSTRNDVRKTWGLTDGTILIGQVGRLDPMKDYPNFLRAAAIITKKRDDIFFVCVGDGAKPYKEKLMDLCKNLNITDKIIWAGLRGDMAKIYNSLDIICSASAYGEGFPNVVGEAMACGIPCVVTDVGDSSWIVEDTGIIVQAKSPNELAEAWEKMLKSDLALLGQKARKRIIENFSLDRLLKNTEEVLIND